MATYDVYWDADAAKELKRLQRRHQRSVARVAARRGDDPWAGNVETIQGGDGLLRARAGDFRVIFHVDQDEQRVIIVAIMPRRDDYPRARIGRWLRRRDRFLRG